MKALLITTRVIMFCTALAASLYCGQAWMGSPFAGAPTSRPAIYPGDSLLPSKDDMLFLGRAAWWMLRWMLLMCLFSLPAIVLESVRACAGCSRFRFLDTTNSGKFWCRECAVGRALTNEDDRPNWLRFIRR